MNEPSILKQSLLLTGKLLGAFAAWVALLSFVAVIVTGRVVTALSGASLESADTPQAPPADAPSQRNHRSAPSPAKPNG